MLSYYYKRLKVSGLLLCVIIIAAFYREVSQIVITPFKLLDIVIIGIIIILIFALIYFLYGLIFPEPALSFNRISREKHILLKEIEEIEETTIEKTEDVIALIDRCRKLIMSDIIHLETIKPVDIVFREKIVTRLRNKIESIKLEDNLVPELNSLKFYLKDLI